MPLINEEELRARAQAAVAPVKKAAGILFMHEGKALLMRRTGNDFPAHWALPGGGVEPGETAEDCARRELEEETGYRYDGQLTFWTRRIQGDTDFTTFVADAPEAFTPKLNPEHDTYTWLDAATAMTNLPLHPGVKIALLRFDLDELGIAKAIKAGELSSPQRFGNVLLVALRITGTGAAYRQALGEYVWRDPSLYLNETFLERCQGLPVIFEHPSGGKALDSEEFRDRIVGTILLPYIQGEEVWGVAKIYDDATAQLLEEEKMSTSPCVVFKAAELGSKHRMPGGSTLLIEGKPSLLDHLAICELGVWDKGGPAAGVANPDVISIGDSTMADNKVEDKKTEVAPEKKETVASDSGLTNSKEGATLDKILAHLDSMSKRMDAMEESRKADSARMDAMCSKMDAAKADGEVKDKGETKELADKKRSDGETDKKESEKKEVKEEKKEEEKAVKKDSARSDADIQAQIAELNRRIPVELSEEDRSRFIEAQSKAERIAQAFGDAAGAPRWVNGESLLQYRRRLAGKFKQHSKLWKEKDLSKCDESIMDIAEAAIYGDAWNAAIRPDSVEGGGLREVVETDRTGRKISRFFGDPEACWGLFKQPSRIVTRWNTKNAEINA